MRYRDDLLAVAPSATIGWQPTRIHTQDGCAGDLQDFGACEDHWLELMHLHQHQHIILTGAPVSTAIEGDDAPRRPQRKIKLSTRSSTRSLGALSPATSLSGPAPPIRMNSGSSLVAANLGAMRLNSGSLTARSAHEEALLGTDATHRSSRWVGCIHTVDTRNHTSSTHTHTHALART